MCSVPSTCWKDLVKVSWFIRDRSGIRGECVASRKIKDHCLSHSLSQRQGPSGSLVIARVAAEFTNGVSSVPTFPPGVLR